MADLSQSFGTLLGQQQQQPDIAQKMSEGVQAGVQLATMQDQVEKSKVNLEQQKTELNDKQFMSATSMLGNLARANPVVAKKMLPQIQQRFQQMGWDPSIPEVIATDENYARNYINVAKGFAPNATDEDKAATLQSMQQLGDFDKGLTELSSSSKLGTQLDIAKSKNEYLATALQARQGNQGDRIQLSANKQYESTMKPAESGLISANRAEDVMSQISENKLKINKTMRADLTSQLASLTGGGRPGTVYGQSAQEFDSAYQRVKDFQNYLGGTANDTLPAGQFKQLQADISALKNLYGQQHETQYQSFREGVPDQVREKLDSRYDTIRKKYGLSTLDQASQGQSQQAPSAPAKSDPVADAFRAKAKAAGKSDAEIEAYLKAKGH
jgi:uncharacterized membrane-anchored protein YhcB (DUF1043 family)